MAMLCSLAADGRGADVNVEGGGSLNKSENCEVDEKESDLFFHIGKAFFDVIIDATKECVFT
ncbi:MAG: hypothetical protein K9J37_03500 [Saprospiraceae bacterium]|nr:hypothetical protein [Saprospiraceae bacterium]MCF8439570.1 hypothetical protein [Saprospiraceae bacterium]